MSMKGMGSWGGLNHQSYEVTLTLTVTVTVTETHLLHQQHPLLAPIEQITYWICKLQC
jgi:hypothetical protein